MISIDIEAQLNSLSWYYCEPSPITNLFRIETGGINGEIIERMSSREHTPVWREGCMLFVSAFNL